MKRVQQLVLIVCTGVLCWLGMQAVHESGHVLGAMATGAEVRRVVLNPLTISRTDLGQNPNPLLVVWAGPIFGVVLPVCVWQALVAFRFPIAFILRFFAGFCSIGNGAYLAVGSFDGVGDCREILINGSPIWLLWLFGAVTIPFGFWLWHGQGAHFGLGLAKGSVDVRAVYFSLFAGLALAVLGFSVGGQ